MGTPVHGKDGKRMQTMLAGENILATEAIDQCPGWIVLAMDGSYARGLLG